MDHFHFFDGETRAVPSVFYTYTLPSKTEEALFRVMAKCDGCVAGYEQTLSDAKKNQTLRQKLFHRHPMLVVLFFLGWRKFVDGFMEAVYCLREVVRIE